MTQQKEATIGNGAAIIERFGGIRPMASKINVPVTTVQGWKKRDAIPAGRMEQIMQAARDHSVDISDILSAPSVANENDKTAFADELKAETERTARPRSAEFDRRPAAGHVSTPMPNVVYEDFTKQISEVEKKAVAKSAMINVIFLLITTAAVVLLLWPQSPIGKKAMSFLALEQDVTQLKGAVADVRREQSTLEAMPADVQQKLDQLQQQVQGAGVAAANAAGVDTGMLEQRLAKLEEHVENIAAGSPALAALMERYQSMQASPEGAGTLSSAWGALSNFTVAYEGAPGDMGPQLENAKAGNPDLATTLEGVPPEDVQAAAILFAMAQVRALLDRENVPVQNDLQVLKILAGTEDPELNAALDRLAPLAGERGVMTPAGLTNQFESIATEVVTASLKGEDVSLQERATAHLNEVLQVEKDGTLITGTPAQATVQRSRTMLQQGDIMGAITEMQSLDGPAATAAVPWLQNANATVAAQQLKSTLNRVIHLKAYGSKGGITAADAPLMTDPASLYKPLNIVH